MKQVEKITHTLEQVDEMRRWFDAQTLPQTMQINSSAYTPDLKDTIDMLFEQAYVCYENPRMQGCFFLLDQIKAKLLRAQSTDSAEQPA